MLTKPWPIIILSWIYFLAPIPNLFISAHFSGRTIPDYIMNFPNPFKALAFFTFFPIAGFAIYKVKKWSYPVFVMVMLWSFWVNFNSFSTYPSNYPIFLLAVVYMVNFALVGYFVIPAVREVYFNERLKWWESKPRYDVEVDLKAIFGDEQIPGRIKNLSVGGVFLELDSEAKTDAVGVLKFSVKNYDFELEGKFLYKNPNAQFGYGVQFTELSRSQKKMLKKLTLELDDDGVKRRPEKTNPIEEFKKWLGGVMSSGKGVVPDVPEHLKRKKS